MGSGRLDSILYGEGFTFSVPGNFVAFSYLPFSSFCFALPFGTVRFAIGFTNYGYCEGSVLMIRTVGMMYEE